MSGGGQSVGRVRYDPIRAHHLPHIQSHLVTPRAHPRPHTDSMQGVQKQERITHIPGVDMVAALAIPRKM